MNEFEKLLRLDNAKEEGVWAYQLSNHELPRQGMKIHISAHGKNFVDVYKTVSHYLHINKISFKTINSEENLQALNTGLLGLTQIGKFITIYPFKDIHSLLVDLEKLCERFQGPIIVSDVRHKKTNIYFRYGVIDAQDDRPNMLITPEGEYITDCRFGKNPIPSWVKEYQISKNETQLLKDIIITSSLRLRGRGGVYNALIKKSNKTIEKIIVKEARPYGEYVSTIDNSLKRIINERNILMRIEKLSISPKLIEYREEDGHGVLFLEKLEGKTLKELLQTYDVFPTEFINNLECQLKKYLKQLHKINIFHGDISPDNLIIDKKLKLIDFEHSCFWSGENVYLDYGTKGFFPSSQTNKKLNQNDLMERDFYGADKCIEALNKPKVFREVMNA
jgi:serine/threonine protein kinase